MAYQALYRKWRPMRFDDVVGQEHVTTTLKNEIKHAHIAHAYLFTGTRGTGKTSTAKIFSRAVNCLRPEDGNPCNQCDVCRGILEERILDIVEIDAASNTGVENIREIIDQGRYCATVSKNRVYIIDEVHMLSQGAFNALLKTLEEPPADVIFILATTEIHKVPATILSRCQRFDFKAITAADIAGRIRYILEQEGISADDGAVDYIAYLGDGSMRDALSILDQCLAFKENGLTYEDVVGVVGALDDTYLFDIAARIAKQDTAGTLEAFSKCISDGRNADYFVESLLGVFRDILMYQIAGEQPDMSRKRMQGVARISGLYTREQTLHSIEVLSDLLSALRFSASPRVLIEVALIKLSQPQLDESGGALLARLSKLENAVPLGGAAYVQHSAVQASSQEGEDLPWPADGEALDAAAKPVSAEKKDKPTVSGNEENVQKEENVQPAANWKDVIDGVMKSGNLMLFTDLFKTTAYLQGDVLYVCFDDAQKRDRTMQKDHLALVQQQVRTVFGTDLPVKCVLESEREPAGGPVDVFEKLTKMQERFPDNVKLDEN